MEVQVAIMIVSSDAAEPDDNEEDGDSEASVE